MLLILKYLLTGLVTSFVLFPFNLPISLTINTKMIVAAVGLALYVLDKTQLKSASISKSLFTLSLLCVAISIWALFSTSINRTSDLAFARYFLSVWVWLAAGYGVVRMIGTVHKKVTTELIGNYLISVCVGQCILAYIMTLSPPIHSFIDSLMGDSANFMGIAEGRVYGLGAALDPAGLRFSGVLIINSFFIEKNDFKEHSLKGILYIISFLIISVLGNMIARSTTVGLLIGFLYLLICNRPRRGYLQMDRSWPFFLGILVVFVLISVLLYNSNSDFRANIRFAFEGFFSLIETGKWQVHSNEILKSMVVFPETLHTWLIGDGLFDHPEDLPDRFGQVYAGYYMKTDIGYLRYIFYFGVIGLIGMISVFCKITLICAKYLSKYRMMFILILAINLLGWIKVSSDIIMVFTPFLILAFMKESGMTNEMTDVLTEVREVGRI